MQYGGSAAIWARQAAIWCCAVQPGSELYKARRKVFFGACNPPPPPLSTHTNLTDAGNFLHDACIERDACRDGTTSKIQRYSWSRVANPAVSGHGHTLLLSNAHFSVEKCDRKFSIAIFRSRTLTAVLVLNHTSSCAQAAPHKTPPTIISTCRHRQATCSPHPNKDVADEARCAPHMMMQPDVKLSHSTFHRKDRMMLI